MWSNAISHARKTAAHAGFVRDRFPGGDEGRASGRIPAPRSRRFLAARSSGRVGAAAPAADPRGQCAGQLPRQILQGFAGRVVLTVAERAGDHLPLAPAAMVACRGASSTCRI